ncbi:MAG TPA: aminoacyl--tRNA ligase-related protein [Candidatus Paceibacterota bacterium]
MLQSKLFSQTLREAPKDDVSTNAEFLIRGGFVEKLMAGVWTYLPLGYRVLENVNAIIREEMNAIGGVELLMSALQPRELWETTNRWKVEEMYKLKDRSGRDLGLGWTHEEAITHIAKTHIHSYRDLPQLVYQIQTKFRDEPRAKSGLIRGREFLMKDLYSFHRSKEDLVAFYDRAAEAYRAIFKRAGLTAYLVEASGGAFTKEFSHEFQVLSPAGEDETVYCKKCSFARNAEVIGDLNKGCPECSGDLDRGKSIEVGNIFKLGTKFSQAFDLTYQNENGEKELVWMGSYGIGPGRLVGTIVEVHHDEKGIIWPASVAPFMVHILFLSDSAKKHAMGLYETLREKKVPVLLDDRADKTPGERFSDADLIGIPWRIVISDKTIAENKIEVKKRNEPSPTLMDIQSFLQLV